MPHCIKVSRHRCRCRFCEQRRTLTRHPGDYIRPPSCGCSRERRARRVALDAGRSAPPTWRIDKYRQDGREQRKRTCRCHGYSFPHFRGRGYCEHNPALTADMLRERYESGSWA